MHTSAARLVDREETEKKHFREQIAVFWWPNEADADLHAFK